MKEIEPLSVASVDKSVDFRVNFQGETNTFNVDFINLKTLQESFEGDELLNLDLEKLPKSVLSSNNYSKGGILKVFDNYTVGLTKDFEFKLASNHSID